MKLIVGLGNIGEKYCFTRHNAGFMVIDRLAIVKGVSFKEEKKFKSFIGKYKYGMQDIILVKPTTFMNLSGDAVQLVMKYYKIDVEDILIVYDDLSLELGKMRFRPSGSDGGHNGIKSIIKCIGTQGFARLKIGIGPQPPVPAEQFVLQDFYKSQLPALKSVIKTAVESIDYYLDNGMSMSQNTYN